MYARRICRHGDVRAVVDDKRHAVTVANSFCEARKAQVFTAAALVLGVVLFSRIEKTFMDTV